MNAAHLETHARCIVDLAITSDLTAAESETEDGLLEV